MSTADRRLLAREATLSTVVAAALAAFLLWATPPGVDWAAHAYQRTFLLEHGFAIWNNFWYAGRYSFVTYSLIYYPLAALLGIKVLALASIAPRRSRSASSSTASGDRRRASRAATSPCSGRASSSPRRSRSRSGCRSRCSRSGRCSTAAAAASPSARSLTLAASPLAFVLLVVVLGGVALARRSLATWASRSRSVAAARARAAPLAAVRRRRTVPVRDAPAAARRRVRGLGLARHTRRRRGAAAARPVLRSTWVAVPRGVRRAVVGRLEHRAIRYLALPLALIAVALRRWRPLRARRAGDRARRGSGTDADCRELRAREHRPGGAARVLAAGIGYLHAHLARPIASRRSTPPSTGPPPTCPSRDPDRARLVPPERLPAERAVYDPKLGRPVRGVAAAMGVRYVVLPTRRSTTARAPRRR